MCIAHEIMRLFLFVVVSIVVGVVGKIWGEGVGHDMLKSVWGSERNVEHHIATAGASGFQGLTEMAAMVGLVTSEIDVGCIVLVDVVQDGGVTAIQVREGFPKVDLILVDDKLNEFPKDVLFSLWSSSGKHGSVRFVTENGVSSAIRGLKRGAVLVLHCGTQWRVDLIVKAVYENTGHGSVLAFGPFAPFLDMEIPPTSMPTLEWVWFIGEKKKWSFVQLRQKVSRVDRREKSRLWVVASDEEKEEEKAVSYLLQNPPTLFPSDKFVEAAALENIPSMMAQLKEDGGALRNRLQYAAWDRNYSRLNTDEEKINSSAYSSTSSSTTYGANVGGYAGLHSGHVAVVRFPCWDMLDPSGSVVLGTAHVSDSALFMSPYPPPSVRDENGWQEVGKTLGRAQGLEQWTMRQHPAQARISKWNCIPASPLPLAPAPLGGGCSCTATSPHDLARGAIEPYRLREGHLFRLPRSPAKSSSEGEPSTTPTNPSNTKAPSLLFLTSNGINSVSLSDSDVDPPRQYAPADIIARSLQKVVRGRVGDRRIEEKILPEVGMGQLKDAPSVPPVVKRLHGELDLQQHGSCEGKNLLAFSYQPDASVQGFSVMFQRLAVALAIARYVNRTLVELEPEFDSWRRTPATLCGSQKYGCVFERELASCRASLPAPPLDPFGRSQEEHRVVFLDRLEPYRALVEAATTPSNAAPDWWGTALMEQEVKNSDALWFAAFQLYLWQPKQSIINAQPVQRARVLFEGNTTPKSLRIGLHHRARDAKYALGRSRAPLEHLVGLAQSIARRHQGPSRIFYASDTPSISSLRQLLALSIPSVTIPFPKGDTRRLNSTLTAELLLTKVADQDALAATAAVMADIDTLSRSHILIGTCFSQVSRIAAELALASGIQLENPIGPDALECSMFRGHFYPILLPWFAHPSTVEPII